MRLLVILKRNSAQFKAVRMSLKQRRELKRYNAASVTKTFAIHAKQNGIRISPARKLRKSSIKTGPLTWVLINVRNAIYLLRKMQGVAI